jgi:hypothetical protein
MSEHFVRGHSPEIDVCVRLDAALVEELARVAQEEHGSFGLLIRRFVEQGLDKWRREQVRAA